MKLKTFKEFVNESLDEVIMSTGNYTTYAHPDVLNPGFVKPHDWPINIYLIAIPTKPLKFHPSIRAKIEKPIATIIRRNASTLKGAESLIEKWVSDNIMKGKRTQYKTKYKMGSSLIYTYTINIAEQYHPATYFDYNFIVKAEQISDPIKVVTDFLNRFKKTDVEVTEVE